MQQGNFICNLMTLKLVSLNDELAAMLETNRNVAMQDPKKILTVLCTENLKYLQHLHTLLLRKGGFSDKKLYLELSPDNNKLLNISASTEGDYIIGFVTELSPDAEVLKLHHDSVVAAHQLI